MASATSFYDFKPLDKKSQPYPLADLQGKVVLVVNTASKCGFTPQFEGLEKLYKDLSASHPNKFTILGFPCNQFMNQDPGDDNTIQEFCKVNYGVSFPVLKKVDVNGDKAEPVFEWMKKEMPGTLGLKRIKWNFEKFLIGSDGQVKARWASTTKPEALKDAILKELGKLPSETATAAAPEPPKAELMDIPQFCSTQLSLLSAELAAETSSTTALLSTSSPTHLSRLGLAITNLVVSSQRTGLGGKTVLELEQDAAIGSGGEIVGEHDIRVGDIVRVGEQPRGGEKKKEKMEIEKGGMEGVVVRVTKRSVQVAVGKDGRDDEVGLDGLGGRVWVVKLANDVTYKRMNQTMEKLQKMQEKDYTTLIRVLFGLEKPSPLPVDLESEDNGIGKLEFVDPTLNDSQKNAVRFALASREVCLIHGPPGTGKTYTLVELILQLLKRGKRVLVCGPSNISVDNIVERLAPHKVPIIRLGHPARLLPSVLNHSLDMLTQNSEAAALVKDIRKEMDDKQASIKKTRNGRERRAIYGEMKELRKEYRERERNCVSNLVKGSKVVLATLHGSGGSQLHHEEFDVVIIDESSQALEAQSWVALLAARKVVLAGDHLQLPPTIKSLKTKAPPVRGKDKPKDSNSDSAINGMTLETTLFDRLLSLYGPVIKCMLTTQYRMHQKIMQFPSDELYESKLVAAEAVKSRLLVDLPYEVKDTEDTKEPLVFWDTQGGEFPEKAEDEGIDAKKSKGALLGDSKSNEVEAVLVKFHVRNLIEAGVHTEDIAIVTPYNAQLALISSMLKERYPGIELGSVDGFQGREKEAIVVSLVRSNAKKEVGFLGEKRRLNVAMTRPKRHLCIIGDSETIGSGSKFLKRWMDFLEENADLRYPNVADLTPE